MISLVNQRGSISKNKKYTSPNIHSWHANKRDHKFIIQTVKNYSTDNQRVAQVLRLVKESGGIEYTIEKMKQFQQQALQLLKTFDDNESRNSLELLVNYVIERKK